MKNRRTISMASLLAVSVSAAQAQFTAGDLVVLQDGTGTAALTSAGTAISLDEFDPSGDAEFNLPIPSTGASALVNSGTATSEGELSLSANGQYVVLAGYNVAAGTTGVASSASSADPRGVATVDANGNYNLASTTSSLFSGNNIRSGTTDGNGNFWATGATGGVANMAPGTPAYVSTTSVNNRLIQDIGGNLYFSTGSGSTRGIYEINGTPTTGPVTATSLINTSSLGSTSPYGFAFNSTMTTAYIADSDAYTSSTGFGGIEKWTYNGTAWAFQYSLPTKGVGADGLAVNFSGANPVIYATSEDGTSLFDITDTGSASAASLLDTASANEAFRGLTFAPTTSVVPEPSGLALLCFGLPGIYWQMRRSRKS